jgi:hypothetical protein
MQIKPSNINLSSLLSKVKETKTTLKAKKY